MKTSFDSSLQPRMKSSKILTLDCCDPKSAVSRTKYAKSKSVPFYYLAVAFPGLAAATVGAAGVGRTCGTALT